jgi:hypothetical protein
MSKSLAEIPDSILASMVRDGCYTVGESIGDGEDDSQFLLVLAVPYGKVDGVGLVEEALENFRELLSADDWQDRNIQILTLKNGEPVVQELAYENL